MKRYEFTITIAGEGDDEASAWVQACEAFALDPGIPDPENIAVYATE
jgi:hypothetical protein